VKPKRSLQMIRLKGLRGGKKKKKKKKKKTPPKPPMVPSSTTGGGRSISGLFQVDYLEPKQRKRKKGFEVGRLRGWIVQERGTAFERDLGECAATKSDKKYKGS